jgi:hypothetical protein
VSFSSRAEAPLPQKQKRERPKHLPQKPSSVCRKYITSLDLNEARSYRMPTNLSKFLISFFTRTKEN